MYQHHIDDMTHAILAAQKDAADDESAIREALTNYWADKIALVWCSEDVHAKANEDGKVLTETAARKVLAEVLRSHDCSYGVSWDSISAAINEQGEDGIRDITDEERERGTVIIQQEEKR